MDLKEELITNNVLLSVHSKNYYNESVFESMKHLKDQNICYVSMNKPAPHLESSFKAAGIDTNNVFFIDAISRGVGPYTEKENMLFVSSPQALSELSIAITQSLSTGVFDVIVFDSLSSLYVMNLKSGSIERFTNFVINKIRAENKKGVFMVLEDDEDNDSMKKSCMYVDKVVRWTEFYETLNHKKHTIAYSIILLIGIFSVFSLSNMTGQFGNRITGYGVLNPQSLSYFTPNVFFLFLVIILVTGLILILRRPQLKTVPAETMANIRPSRASPKSIKQEFNKKVSVWYKHHNGMNIQ
ncbi:MAG: hypothetical protein ABII01_05950 [Candidatus Woesearchaeota archaeon]